MRGDAVAIELPGQVTLFALLRLADPKRGDLASMAMRQFDPRFLNDRLESARRIARSDHVTAAVALAREDFPQLVLFTDPRDSKSIRIIDSGSTDPAIEKISIGVQLTDDPVSTGVLEKLPDFGAKSGFDEWLRTLSYGDPRIISSTDFEQGSK